VLASASQFSSGLFIEEAGSYTAVEDEKVIASALRIVAQRLVRGDALIDPRRTREYLAMRFAGLEHEVFCCLYLDNCNRVIACEELFRGTIDGAWMHPREVVKQVLIHNAELQS
jgi:DNA repair protein RadC